MSVPGFTIVGKDVVNLKTILIAATSFIPHCFNTEYYCMNKMCVLKREADLHLSPGYNHNSGFLKRFKLWLTISRIQFGPLQRSIKES